MSQHYERTPNSLQVVLKVPFNKSVWTRLPEHYARQIHNHQEKLSARRHWSNQGDQQKYVHDDIFESALQKAMTNHLEKAKFTGKAMAKL